MESHSAASERSGCEYVRRIDGKDSVQKLPIVHMSSLGRYEKLSRLDRSLSMVSSRAPQTSNDSLLSEISKVNGSSIRGYTLEPSV